MKREKRKWHLTYESYTVKMWILQLSYNQTLLLLIYCTFPFIPIIQSWMFNPFLKAAAERCLIILMTAFYGMIMVTMSKEVISNSSLKANIWLLIGFK